MGLGETGLSGNAYVGLMEYEDMAFLLHALRSDDVFVDVGANIGAYTILASKVVKSRAIAFEPLPETVDKLVDQIKLNRIDSIVKVRGVGVGESRGALFFTNGSDTTNKVSAAGCSESTTEIEVISLDDELENDLNYFVKIDVEGFECNVLRGAKRVLSGSNVVAVIVEMNGSGSEFGFSDNEVHDALVGFGFVPIDYDPVARLVTCLDSYNRRRGNTIYVKDVEDVARRCSSAPKRTIHTAGGVRI
ncbi:MAG: FkbM family methyltransferase [Proteobacteria bacterium]|nr:MAG: FkbM family methyltransferase [Pseudomonadota bacterium]